MEHNPSDGNVSVYECYECGARVESKHNEGVCPQCAGTVRNITVVRE